MTDEEKQRLAEVVENRRIWHGSMGQVTKDIDFLLSLVKSQEAGCSLCGGPHDFDTSIPSVVWNSVIRACGLPDYLCTTCIVREFVRAGQSFTATLWNEEFSGIPIEVIVNGQNAKDATAIQEENNSLRAEFALCRQVQGRGQHSSSMCQCVVAIEDCIRVDAATAMRSACVEKVKSTRAEWQRKSEELDGDADLIDRLALEGDVHAANRIIKELESLSLQEQEK